MIKRCATKAIVFLLAGAIINVAVAWACAIFIQYDPSLNSYGVWHFEHAQSDSWVMYSTKPGAEITKVLKLPRRMSVGEAKAVLNGQQLVPKYAFPYCSADKSCKVVSNGWPYLSLHSVVVFGDNKSRRVKSGIPIDRDANGKVLPLNPLIGRTLANTVIYAAIVWMLFAVPGVVRRRMRRKRGQCAACGYSLRGRGTSGGEKCPECGATTIKQKAETQKAQME
jgi:predicted RNA-binding Zn-ribbon protein involved in translation (DUF1610 family)